jgi:hypothetical protein
MPRFDDYEKKVPQDKDKFTKAEEYVLCPAHNMRYPSGGVCPRCVSDMKRK